MAASNPVGNPNWRKGVSGNPLGKPKGALSKYHRFQVAMRSSDLSPVEFLLAVMRRDADALAAIDVPIEEVTLDVRRACAIDLLPFCHSRLPQAVNVNANGGIDEDALQVGLSMLSDAELNTVRKALGSAAVIGKAVTYESGPSDVEDAV